MSACVEEANGLRRRCREQNSCYPPLPRAISSSTLVLFTFPYLTSPTRTQDQKQAKRPRRPKGNQVLGRAAGRRLYFRGSASHPSIIHPLLLALPPKTRTKPPIQDETKDANAPFLDIRTLSLVPLPPSQKPEPAFPVRGEWQMAQSSGR